MRRLRSFLSLPCLHEYHGSTPYEAELVPLVETRHPVTCRDPWVMVSSPSLGAVEEDGGEDVKLREQVGVV